jgi:hypothetical protein
MLNSSLGEIKSVSARTLSSMLPRTNNVFAVVIDGTATPNIMNSAEEANVKVIVAKNFTSTSSRLQLLSF